jgi:hypothetical protein
MDQDYQTKLRRRDDNNYIHIISSDKNKNNVTYKIEV